LPDSQGNLTVLKGIDALNNAIKLWLASFRGERLYQPYRGGPIIGYLLKPMSDDSANDMRIAIREGLKNDFTPSVKTSKCEVFCDYDNAQYVVDIEGFCPSMNSDVKYTDKINSLRERRA